MTSILQAERAPVDEAGIEAHLEAMFARHFGLGRSILSLVRRPSAYASSFRMDEIDVRLDDGSELPVIMKDLSADALSTDARRARPRFVDEPCREICAYQRLLSRAPAGTASCYGAISDYDERRHWLFLERVDGLELRHVGAFQAWEAAAAWIGCFHHAFLPTAEGLADSAKLLVYDEHFYWRWMERALRFARPDREASAALMHVARHYGPVVDRLMHLPRTVIHGEFYPSNILIASGMDRRRVCPVDWEMTALAPGLMDLASLSAGWGTKARRALAAAYSRSTPDGRRMTPDDTRDFFVNLACCRLHLAIKMLGWSGDWAPPPQHACDWLAEAVTIFPTCRAGSSSKGEAAGRLLSA